MPRHATTEQLSAHLDGRSEVAEAAFLAEHLAACARCADELAGLAALRDLTRRLPVVPPPRSFALPISSAPRAPARTLRFPRLTTVTRAASAVAAAFFVLFFTADMSGLGEDRSLPVTGALSPDALTISSSATTPSQPAATPPGAATAGPREAAPAKPAAAAKPAPAAAAPAALPTPVLRPPARAAGETATAESRGASDAAQQADAHDRSGGGSSEGRARLGAMASSVNQLAGSPSPLRWSWIGTGLLALVLLVGSLIVGRRRGH